jgi:hypothetical protein
MMEDWTNIAKTVSASQDEEVWVEQIFYRDSKDRDEYMEECGNNENIERLYKQFMDLITPGFGPIIERAANWILYPLLNLSSVDRYQLSEGKIQIL